MKNNLEFFCLALAGAITAPARDQEGSIAREGPSPEFFSMSNNGQTRLKSVVTPELTHRIA